MNKPIFYDSISFFAYAFALPILQFAVEKYLLSVGIDFIAFNTKKK